MTLRKSSKFLNEQTPTVSSASFKAYLLKRIFSVGYDEFDGKVIVAESPKMARLIANLKTGTEGQIWTNAKLVSCKEIPLTRDLVVLESFNAG